VPTRMVAWATAIVTAYVVALTVAEPRVLIRDAPGANLVIQTTAALVAVLVAVIAFGRFRQRRKAAELFVVLALAHLAAGTLLFTVLPMAAGDVVPSRTVWAGALTRLAGALLLAAAAHVPLRAVDPPRWMYADEVAVAALTGIVVVSCYAVAARLGTVPTATRGERVWDTAPSLAVVLGVTALASAVAAVGFVRRRAGTPGDALLGWLAVATILAAGAHAAAAGTTVTTYSAGVAVGDLLRLASYLVLLGGALHEIRGYWRDRAAAIVAEERRRMARELHDGLAQELAYVVTRTRMLARRRSEDLWDVCSAAERALDESRRAIAALTSDIDEPLDLALAHTAEDVAGRLGTHVTLELAPVDVSGDAKEALLRIAREAITNAARHGAATRVHVRLSGENGVLLRVSDNGRGFDLDAPPAAGRLGIVSMRERAAALGGVLTVRRARPSGIEVEVVLP